MKITLNHEQYKELRNFTKVLLNSIDHRNIQINLSMTPPLIQAMKLLRINIHNYLKCHICGKRAYHILHIDKLEYPTMEDYIKQLLFEFPNRKPSVFHKPHYWCGKCLPDPCYTALGEIPGVVHKFL